MNNNEFHYTYSAKEQSEIKRIREKYLTQTKPKEVDRMEELRRLDLSATQSATVVSLCIGIIGTLIMGFGMSLIMTDLRNLFSIDRIAAMISGIIIGLVGVVAVLLAYPLYHRITKWKRKKVAPEILRLIEELLQERA